MTLARTRMTAGQRRDMVLQAALIEFATRGLDGTSTQDIARRAGISTPTCSGSSRPKRHCSCPWSGGASSK